MPRVYILILDEAARITAAVSGVATRLLARDDAHDLAILGRGVQARSHLAATRMGDGGGMGETV